MKVNNKLRSDSHRVGGGFSVRFEMCARPAGLALSVEWAPRPPAPRELRRVLPRYRRARDLFLCEVSRITGLGMACVEMEAPACNE